MVQLNGFIKIHRKLLQWGWYQDNVVKGVFLHLLLTANFKDMAWQGRTIKRGQVVTSYKHLSEDLGFGVRQIRTALDKLKSTGEVTSETTNKYTIITVVNWEEYQVIDSEPTHNTTKSVTNDRQALSVTKMLQTINEFKKLTSKTTSKEELETLVNSTITEFTNQLETSIMTNNRQTTDKQETNDRQQRKKDKEYKERKEKKKPPSGGGIFDFYVSDESESRGEFFKLREE